MGSQLTYNYFIYLTTFNKYFDRNRFRTENFIVMFCLSHGKKSSNAKYESFMRCHLDAMIGKERSHDV